MLISKELLSEVLGEKVHYLEQSQIGAEYLAIHLNDGSSKKEINVFELAHKVKSWCYDKGYPLTLFMANNIVHTRIYLKDDNEKRFYSPEYDEPDGVFQAGQWILDKKDSKCITK